MHQHDQRTGSSPFVKDDGPENRWCDARSGAALDRNDPKSDVRDTDGLGGFHCARGTAPHDLMVAIEIKRSVSSLGPFREGGRARAARPCMRMHVALAQRRPKPAEHPRRSHVGPAPSSSFGGGPLRDRHPRHRRGGRRHVRAGAPTQRGSCLDSRGGEPRAPSMGTCSDRRARA